MNLQKEINKEIKIVKLCKIELWKEKENKQ